MDQSAQEKEGEVAKRIRIKGHDILQTGRLDQKGNNI